MELPVRLAFMLLCTGLIAASIVKIMHPVEMYGDYYENGTSGDHMSRSYLKLRDLSSTVGGLSALAVSGLTNLSTGDVTRVMTIMMFFMDWIAMVLRAKFFMDNSWYMGGEPREYYGTDSKKWGNAGISPISDWGSVVYFTRALSPRRWTICFATLHLIYNISKRKQRCGLSTPETVDRSEVAIPSKISGAGGVLDVQPQANSDARNSPGGLRPVNSGADLELGLRHIKEVIGNLEIVRTILPSPYQLPHFMGNITVTGLSQSCDVYVRHALHTLNMLSLTRTSISPTFSYAFFDPCKQYERLMDAMSYVANNIGMRLVGTCPPPKSDLGVFIYSDEDSINRILLELFSYITTYFGNSPKLFINFMLLPKAAAAEQLGDIRNKGTKISGTTFEFSSSVTAVWRLSFANFGNSEPNSYGKVINSLSSFTRQFLEDSGMMVTVLNQDDEPYTTIILDFSTEAVNCMDSHSVHSPIKSTKIYGEMSEMRELCSSLKHLKNIHFLHVGSRISDVAEIVFVYYSALGAIYKPILIDDDVNGDSLTSRINHAASKTNKDARKLPTIITIDDEPLIFNSLVQNMSKLPPATAVIYFFSLSAGNSSSSIDALLSLRLKSCLLYAVPKPLGPVKLYMTIIHAFTSMPNRAQLDGSKITCFGPADRDTASHHIPSGSLHHTDCKNMEQPAMPRQKDYMTLTPRKSCIALPLEGASALDFVSIEQGKVQPQDSSRPSNMSFFRSEYRHDIPKLATGVNALVAESMFEFSPQ